MTITALNMLARFGLFAARIFTAIAVFSLLFVGGMGSVAWSYDVTLNQGITDANEGSLAPNPRNSTTATCTLVRNSAGADLTVNLRILSSSTADPDDYELHWYNAATSTWDEFGADEATSGQVTFVAGQTSINIRLTPEKDNDVEGREYVTIAIETTPSLPYNIGAFPSRRLTIQDDDHIARIQVVQPVADEDISLRGDPDDPISRRRAIVRVRFDPFADQAESFSRNLAVQFIPSIGPQPTATFPDDYTVRYKICGHSNWGTVPTGTQEHSQLGRAYNSTTDTSATTGLNFRLMAALAGDTSIELRNDPDSIEDDIRVPVNSTIAFKSDPNRNSYLVTGSTLSQLQISPALKNSVPNGTDVILLTAPSGAVPSTITVEKQYPAGSTQLLLGGGFGRLYQGDVIQLDGDPLSYVIISDPGFSNDGTTLDPDGADNVPDTIDSQGRVSARVSIFAFEGGVGGGLNVAQTDAVGVTTLLTPSIDTNGKMELLIPSYSTKLEISIEPKGAPDGKETAEAVRMRMIADADYIIQTPQDVSVVIADRDVVAGVSIDKNAGLPSTNGTIRFNLSESFPVPVKVPFEVTSFLNNNTAVSAEGPTGCVQVLPREITFAANTTTALLTVVPNGVSGRPGTLTVTLLGTEDYKLGGSESSSTNPSATMHINDVIGTVSIAATTATAIEGSPATNGEFTVTISRLSGMSAAVVSLKLSVGGTAVNGSRYEFFNSASPSEVYAVTNKALNQIQIPSGQNSIRIGVRPIDNQVADGTETVQLNLVTQDVDYSVSNTSNAATVTIQDNEPTISVAVIDHAARPSTQGRFRFSYPGGALDQSVLVKFSYDGAVLNTDFVGSSTVTINSGFDVADLIITPTTTGTATSLTVKVIDDVPYNVALPPDNSATMRIDPEPPPQSASSNKPTPGSVTSSSGGGCGLGSGVAGFLALGLLLMLAWRRRQI